MAVLTALRLVRGAGSVAGRRVLVTGAGRGIGRLLVELAAALGAEVTAVVRDAGEAAETARLGARQVVTADAVPGAFEGSFDVVYEAAAGDLIAAGRGLAADGATVFLYESWPAPPEPSRRDRAAGGLRAVRTRDGRAPVERLLGAAVPG
ncbi:zinc-binding dehydrogenase [Streptomyces katrae]|uniref:Zinc-binding dehydrogenase n=1 Tax=Streptomyces katrae TaxID=68223 RepID=A0ABT7H3W8_9ACTN|nr:zinc-binding dehydrogenase [Streptomyces katrae]MDK9500591.1 zinc-binding dehydrogenase [Streptomyces katrae]